MNVFRYPHEVVQRINEHYLGSNMTLSEAVEAAFADFPELDKQRKERVRLSDAAIEREREKLQGLVL